jgi:hypothetical protein
MVCRRRGFVIEIEPALNPRPVHPAITADFRFPLEPPTRDAWTSAGPSGTMAVPTPAAQAGMERRPAQSAQIAIGFVSRRSVASFDAVEP